MRVLVTGNNPISKELVMRGYDQFRYDPLDLDDVIQGVQEANPDVIIHCSELSDIAYCEEHQSEAFAQNVRSVHNFIYDFVGTFIYISTAYVFNGERMWEYNERHRPDPKTIYGFTKWSGEVVAMFRRERTLIIRTSELFDYSAMKSSLSMLNAGEVLGFDDKIRRSFLYVPHFVDGLVGVLDKLEQFKDPDILNIAGKDTLSPYKFWLLAAKTFDISEKLIALNDEKPSNAKSLGLNVNRARKLGVPLYSALDGLNKMKSDMESF